MKNILITFVLSCFMIIFITCLIKNDLLESILKIFKNMPKLVKVIIYILAIVGGLYIIRI